MLLSLLMAIIQMKWQVIKMTTDKVNWDIFNIDPEDDDSDVSKQQVIEEFSKFDGTPREFVMELDKRFGYSGMMCEIVENWLS